MLLSWLAGKRWMGRQWLCWAMQRMRQDIMEEQRKSCEAIIESKNTLIAHLRKELKVKVNDLNKLLRQQTEDIAQLITKMHEQAEQMSSACQCAAALS